MGRRFALLLGNSVYQDANFPPLKTPEADVSRFAGVLRDPAIGAFEDVQVQSNASASEVRRAVGRFFTGRTSDDLLLLYFSGHGVLDEAGHLYLAFSDAEHDLIRATAVPASEIAREMDNSNSRRMVWILDCCHSGAFKRGTKAMLGQRVGIEGLKGDGFGRVVLTASSATQYAWEGDQVIGNIENSLFTHFLVQGLETGEADLGNDGEVTVDELYQYVFDRVVEVTPKQTPSKYQDEQKGQLTLAKSKPRVVPVTPKPLPSEVLDAIHSPLPRVREAAVEQLNELLDGAHPEYEAAALGQLEKLEGDDSNRVRTAATNTLTAYRASEAREPIEASASVVPISPAKPATAQFTLPPTQGAPTGAASSVKQAQNGPKTVRASEPRTFLKSVGGIFRTRRFWPPVLFTGLAWGTIFVLVVLTLPIISDFMHSLFATFPNDFVYTLKTGPGTYIIDGAMIGILAGLAMGVVMSRQLESFGWMRIAELSLILGGLFTFLGFVYFQPVVVGWPTLFIQFLVGLAVGLVLRRAEPRVTWPFIIFLAIGWSVGWFVGGLVILAVGGSNMAIFGALMGFFGGALASIPLFAILSYVREDPAGDKTWSQA